MSKGDRPRVIPPDLGDDYITRTSLTDVDRALRRTFAIALRHACATKRELYASSLFGDGSNRPGSSPKSNKTWGFILLLFCVEYGRVHKVSVPRGWAPILRRAASPRQWDQVSTMSSRESPFFPAGQRITTKKDRLADGGFHSEPAAM